MGLCASSRASGNSASRTSPPFLFSHTYHALKIKRIKPLQSDQTLHSCAVCSRRRQRHEKLLSLSSLRISLTVRGHPRRSLICRRDQSMPCWDRTKVRGKCSRERVRPRRIGCIHQLFKWSSGLIFICFDEKQKNKKKSRYLPQNLIIWRRYILLAGNNDSLAKTCDSVNHLLTYILRRDTWQ